MRQTVRLLAICWAFSLFSPASYGEPILGGRFIENPPALLGVKPLFLAHIFNSGMEVMKAGNYQVGLELQNGKKKKTYVVKPTVDVLPGQLQTFRITVVPTTEDRAGLYKIFSRAAGNTHFSDSYSFKSGKVSSGKMESIPLYVEAPPEPFSTKPPAEILFENETPKHPAPSPEAKPLKPVQEKPIASPPAAPKPVACPPAAVAAKPEKAQEEKPEARKDAEKPRAIDSSEFKTLRTIDEELVIYVIKKGDTLKSVAEKFYGNSGKEKVIADFNFIENASSIKPGEEIIVDVRPLKSSKSKSEKLKKPADEAGITDETSDSSARSSSQTEKVGKTSVIPESGDKS